jgi:hypothetical protein
MAAMIDLDVPQKSEKPISILCGEMDQTDEMR